MGAAALRLNQAREVESKDEARPEIARDRSLRMRWQVVQLAAVAEPE